MYFAFFSVSKFVYFALILQILSSTISTSTDITVLKSKCVRAYLIISFSFLTTTPIRERIIPNENDLEQNKILVLYKLLFIYLLMS